jgi:hypothetical protein
MRYPPELGTKINQFSLGQGSVVPFPLMFVAHHATALLCALIAIYPLCSTT